MSAVGRFRRLREMLDVTWPVSPTDGHVLTYDSATSKMKLAAGGGGGSLPAQWTVDSAGDLEIAPDEGGSGDAPLVVVGTDDHFEIQAWKNKTGNTVGDIDTSGTLSIIGPLSIGGSVDVGDATTFFADGSQNTVHDVIQANAAGDVKAGVNADGALYTQLHAAPSDAHVFAGRLTIWFDNTNGAAKLMVKAKDAGGNIVTGEIPLT